MGKKSSLKKQRIAAKKQNENESNINFKPFIFNKHNIIIITILTLLPLSIYWQATSFSFVRDDVYHLTKNPHLQNLSFNNTVNLFKEPYLGGIYIPVTYLTWGLLKPIGQFISPTQTPFYAPVYHAFNIFVHVINGLLVFFIIFIILKNNWAAFAGALFFLLHPLQVESVAWISELRGLLGTMFGLGSLLVYMISGYRDFTSKKQYRNRILISMLLLALAVLSKPSAIVIPFIAFIIDFFFIKKAFEPALKRIVPLVIVVIPIAIQAIISQPYSEHADKIPSLFIRPLIWMDSINFYLFKIIFPYSLATSYARTPQFVAEQWWLYLEWLIPVAIGLLLWKTHKKFPVFAAAFLILIIGYLPISGLLWFVYQNWSTVADRFIYLPMVGPALAFGYFISRFQQRIVKIIAFSILLVLGVRSYAVQIPTWKNSPALWEQCIEVVPYETKAYLCLGDIFLKEKDYDKAISEYDKGLNLADDSEGYNSRGNAFLGLKQFERAMQDYNKALQLKTDNANAYNNRGSLLMQMKKFDKALKDLDKAVQLAPHDERPFINRGALHFQMNHYSKSLSDFDSALRINPRLENAYSSKAGIFFIQKNYKMAITELNAVIRLNPSNGYAYQNRAKANYFTSNYKSAWKDEMKAQKLGHASHPAFLDSLRKYVNKSEAR